MTQALAPTSIITDKTMPANKEEQFNTDINRNVDFKCLKSLIKQAQQSIEEGGRNNDLVLFVGKSGMGKSSTINYCMGSEMGFDSEGNFGVREGEKEYAPAGHDTMKAKTLYSALIKDKHNGINYCDCPGFADTGRTLEESICASLGVPFAIKFARNIKSIVVAIDYSAIMAPRSEVLPAVLDEIGAILKNTDTLIDKYKSGKHPCPILFAFNRAKNKAGKELDKKGIFIGLSKLQNELENQMKEISAREIRTDYDEDRSAGLGKRLKTLSLLMMNNGDNIFLVDGSRKSGTDNKKEFIQRLQIAKPLSKDDLILNVDNSHFKEIASSVANVGIDLISRHKSLPGEINSYETEIGSCDQRMSIWQRRLDEIERREIPSAVPSSPILASTKNSIPKSLPQGDKTEITPEKAKEEFDLLESARQEAKRNFDIASSEEAAALVAFNDAQKQQKTDTDRCQDLIKSIKANNKTLSIIERKISELRQKEYAITLMTFSAIPSEVYLRSISATNKDCPILFKVEGTPDTTYHIFGSTDGVTWKITELLDTTIFQNLVIPFPEQKGTAALLKHNIIYDDLYEEITLDRGHVHKNRKILEEEFQSLSTDDTKIEIKHFSYTDVRNWFQKIFTSAVEIWDYDGQPYNTYNFHYPLDSGSVRVTVADEKKGKFHAKYFNTLSAGDASAEAWLYIENRNLPDNKRRLTRLKEDIKTIDNKIEELINERGRLNEENNQSTSLKDEISATMRANIDSAISTLIAKQTNKQAKKAEADVWEAKVFVATVDPVNRANVAAARARVEAAEQKEREDQEKARIAQQEAMEKAEAAKQAAINEKKVEGAGLIDSLAKAKIQKAEADHKLTTARDKLASINRSLSEKRGWFRLIYQLSEMLDFHAMHIDSIQQFVNLFCEIDTETREEKRLKEQSLKNISIAAEATEKLSHLQTSTKKHLYCPLGNEIMIDPVQLPDGCCYERQNIIQHYDKAISQGKMPICPNKDAPFTDPRLMPTNLPMQELCVIFRSEQSNLTPLAGSSDLATISTSPYSASTEHGSSSPTFLGSSSGVVRVEAEGPRSSAALAGNIGIFPARSPLALEADVVQAMRQSEASLPTDELARAVVESINADQLQQGIQASLKTTSQGPSPRPS